MTITASAPHSLRVRRRHSSGAGLRAGMPTHIILLVFSVFSILPFLSMILVSVYPNGQAASGLHLPDALNWSNYARAWETAGFGVLLKNSAVVAVTVLLLGSFICILTGYAFGTMRFAGSGVLFTVFLIGLIMPFEATIIPLYYDLRSVGMANTYMGLILPETALYLSFGTFWMRSNFEASERSLVEAARLDGLNSWQILWRILVPNSWPAITTMMVLFFIWSWNEFLLALVLAQDPAVQTSPAGLGLFSGQYTTDTSGLAAAAMIMTTPALLIYVVLQRHFIQGVTSGGVKG